MKNLQTKKIITLAAFTFFLGFVLILSAVAQTGGEKKQTGGSPASAKPPKPTPTPTPEPPPDTQCYSGPGCLDVSFGTNGVVTNYDQVQVAQVLVQNDGKIVTAGVSRVNDMIVTRFDTTGALDPTFGGIGYVLVDFGGDFEVVKSVAIQPDGKIVIIGPTSASGVVGVARLTTDGQLDPFFGINGKVTMNFTDSQDLALQSDGKIVISGGYGNMTVLRLNYDGTPDAGFGAGGFVTVNVSGSRRGSATGNSVAMQWVAGSERIVVGGFSNTGGRNSSADFALVRLSPDGSVDNTFGDNGKILTDFFGQSDQIYGLAIDSSNRILAVGAVYTVGSPARIAGFARYLEDGTPDQSFGNSGLSTLTDIYGGRSVAESVAIQSDGKILVSGEAWTPEPQPGYIFLVRLNENGIPDTGFGPGTLGPGIVTTRVGPTSNYGLSIAIQPDGKIVVGGTTTVAGTANALVVRFYP